MNSHYDPHDGDRVRLYRFDGPLGTVVLCKGTYFKVKPDAGGRWWPIEHLVADSQGTHTCTCTDCDIRFRSDDFYAPLCPNCTGRQQERDSRRSAGTSPIREGDMRRRVHYPQEHSS